MGCGCKSSEKKGQTEVLENANFGEQGLNEISVEKAKAQEKVAEAVRASEGK